MKVDKLCRLNQIFLQNKAHTAYFLFYSSVALNELEKGSFNT